jgi:NADH-quinone oxidoreductase subunit F
MILKELIDKKNVEKTLKELNGDRITIGMATCGLSAGAKEVYDALKKAKLTIPIDIVGCSGMCYNEPIITIKQNNKTSIYGKITINNVDKLIKAINKKEILKEFFLAEKLEKIDYYKKQIRHVTFKSGFINPLNLNHYIALGGFNGLVNAINIGPKKTIEEVTLSGLRGRGGAGFPTGRKWSFIADKKTKKYLIGNGDEGDPGAFMNRTLMESDPFSIIEGLLIAAFSTGAGEGFIYTRAEYPLAIKTLNEAIKIAYNNNLLGKNILGINDFNFDLSIKKGAGAFVCGEETALIKSSEGKRGSPLPRPPFPAQKGLFNYPTIVNNVGTLGHVAYVMNIGAKEFSKIGTQKTKGTKILCLTGKVKHSGIIEIPIGIKLKDIVFNIGGGIENDKKFKAILTGGPAGGCIPKEKINTTLDYENMLELGSIMGSGGIVVISEESCIVDIARFFMNFTQEESCGKCTPCREGTKRLLEMLESITEGKANLDIIPKMKNLALFIKNNALCGLGQAAPNPVLSTLRYFEKEYIEHIKNKKCFAGVCSALLSFFITDKCIGCGACKKVCPTNAISGNLKEKHIINQEKCIKCGSCYNICPVMAIIKK